MGDMENAIDDYIATWGADLSKKAGYPINGRHEISTFLINDKKTRNYATALAIVFGLGWVSHKDYLDRVLVAFKKYHEENGLADVTPELLADWVNYYCTEVDEYPAG